MSNEIMVNILEISISNNNTYIYVRLSPLPQL